MAVKTGTITLDQFAGEINKLIGEWKVDVEITLEDASDSAINVSKHYIKNITKESGMNHSRKKKANKRYVNCFTTRKPNRNKKFLRALWNREYRLSHLLEDGHDSYNQYNTPGNKHYRDYLPRPYTIHTSKFPDSIGRTHTHSFGVWEKTEKYMGVAYYKTVKKSLIDLNRRRYL